MFFVSFKGVFCHGKFNTIHMANLSTSPWQTKFTYMAILVYKLWQTKFIDHGHFNSITMASLLL